MIINPLNYACSSLLNTQIKQNLLKISGDIIPMADLTRWGKPYSILQNSESLFSKLSACHSVSLWVLWLLSTGFKTEILSLCTFNTKEEPSSECSTWWHLPPPCPDTHKHGKERSALTWVSFTGCSVQMNSWTWQSEPKSANQTHHPPSPARTEGKGVGGW